MYANNHPMTYRVLFLLWSIAVCDAAPAQTTIMHVKNDKNPGTAFVMGLFVPGSGQMYNDQVELGLGLFAVSTGLLVGGASVYGSTEYSNATSIGGALMVAGGTLSLAGAVYAALHSRKTNRDNGVDKRMPGATSSRMSFGLNSTGVGLALSF